MEVNLEITDTESTQKNKYLTFVIAETFYAIEIKHVTEIIGMQTITEVPQVPEYIKGIINLRGKIIPVMDVRLRFQKEEIDYNDRTCVIVIEIENISLGLIVDCVSEVLVIDEENILVPPDMNKDTGNKYVEAIGKVDNTVKLIVNCEKLISDKSIESLANVE